MIKKAVKSNITESVRSNIIFINTFLCWICFIFLAKTGQCKRRRFGYSNIPFIFHCNVRNHLALEYMLCDFVYIAWKYVGRYRMFIWNCHWSYIESGQFIFRESGIVFFQSCELNQLMSESWIYGTLVSFIVGLLLFAVLPMALKKRG